MRLDLPLLDERLDAVLALGPRYHHALVVYVDERCSRVYVFSPGPWGEEVIIGSTECLGAMMAHHLAEAYAPREARPIG